MTDSNTVLDLHDPLIVPDLLRTTLDTLHDSYNRKRSLDSSTLNTISDSDRLSCLIATSDPPELVVHTASKIIENEIQSFLDSFSTSSLQTDTVPILIFPEHLGKIINKCIRYYAAICNLAPFYIDVRGVKVLVACSNKYLRPHHLNSYNELFLSRPEDCEHVSVAHLFNCIHENKKRNHLRRNLSQEFKQDDLISESSDLKPFAFLIPKGFDTSSVLKGIVKQEMRELKFKEDIVMKSTLNVNAQEFVPQKSYNKSEVFEESDLVTASEISTIYSFLPISSVKTDNDLTCPYLFTPDSNCRDFSYDSAYFKLGSTASNSTPEPSVNPLPSSKSSGDSIQSNVSGSLLKHNDSYYLTRKRKDSASSPTKQCMTESVIHSCFPLREYAELDLSLKAKSVQEKSSSESALVPVIKNLEEDSSTGLPQFSSEFCLSIGLPKYFTSTPKPKSPITKENVSPFSFSYAASTSSDLNKAHSPKELATPFNYDHSSTTDNSPFGIPGSPISLSEGSEKQLEYYKSYAQPLSSLTSSSSSCQQVFTSSSNVIQSPTASSSLMYYTAEPLSSSTDLSHAQFTISSSILSTHIADPMPSSSLQVQPTSSTVDFETPLAPTRYSPQLQLLATKESTSPISSNILSILSSANSQDETTATSMETSLTATSMETSLPPKSICGKSVTPEEFTSPRSNISEKTDNPFMEGPKHYIDYIIEYKDFVEQVSNFVEGSPLLVRSLRNIEDFKCLLKRHKNIIELYNIPESCKTLDILRVYHEEPRCMIWCDGSHALLVNQSPEQAERALKFVHKFIRSRPIEDASPVATVIACSYELELVFETLDKWIKEKRSF